MTGGEKQNGFMNKIKGGLGMISNIISASIFPSIAEGAEMVMKNIEDRIIRIKKKVLREISTLIIIGFGGVFLILALLFYLTESLGWSNAAACFSIGIIVFVIGLLLKLAEPDR